MKKKYPCRHCYPVLEASDKPGVDQLLANVLRYTGNCPECSSPSITAASLRRLQQEVPDHLRIGVDGIWQPNDLEIGALVLVRVDTTKWHGSLGGNIGLSEYFIGCFLEFKDNRMRFRLRPGLYMSPSQRAILDIAVVIPASHKLPDEYDLWSVEGKIFSLTPDRIPSTPTMAERSLSLVA